MHSCLLNICAMVSVKFWSDDSSLLDALMDSVYFTVADIYWFSFIQVVFFLVLCMTSYFVLHPGYCYYEILKFFADRTLLIFLAWWVDEYLYPASCRAPQHCSAKSGVTPPWGLGRWKFSYPLYLLSTSWWNWGTDLHTVIDSSVEYQVSSPVHLSDIREEEVDSDSYQVVSFQRVRTGIGCGLSAGGSFPSSFFLFLITSSLITLVFMAQ